MDFSAILKMIKNLFAREIYFDRRMQRQWYGKYCCHLCSSFGNATALLSLLKNLSGKIGRKKKLTKNSLKLLTLRGILRVSDKKQMSK